MNLFSRIESIMSKYYIANSEELDKLVGSTGKSISAIARSGGITRTTLDNALEGKRIMKSSANGIINGLNENNAKPKAVFKNLFKEEDK